MELTENEPQTQGVLPEPEPRYHTATLPTEKTEHGQGLVRILAAVLVGLILIVLIILLARWIYHKAHHAVVEPAPSTSLKTPAASSNNPASGARPGSGSTSATASNNPSTTTPPGSSSNTNTQITNTGPGDVAAIFAGTALAAAGLHYIISVRRFSQGQS